LRLPVLNRRIHYWVAAASALPVLVILASGILLHFKKQAAWIQPPERRGEGTAPAIAMDRILEASRGVPEAGVRDWSDILRVDLRPSKGMLKVTARSNWEIQIDAATGGVLQSAYRRSDLIEGLHNGSWFHDAVKTWIFLPSGIALLLLWVTGLWLFLRPYLARSARSRPPSG
jgi:uncharacterized iron-regulated membrane protein